jgi:hypothetical protein
MVKPIGGRGKKAPYQTVQMRIPLPIKSEVEKLVEQYRGVILSGDETPIGSTVKPEYGFLEKMIQEVLADPAVTRNGRDRGSVKRGFDALLQKLLSLQPND